MTSPSLQQRGAQLVTYVYCCYGWQLGSCMWSCMYICHVIQGDAGQTWLLIVDHIHLQRSRLRRPISKIRMVLLMDAKIWMTSLIIMFAVRPTCVQDSLFKMSSESPDLCLNSWWRHQMETFSALLALCAGNSPVTGEFHAQRPVTWSFGVFFDLHMNKLLSKQSWSWWFETPSHLLWHHCNVMWSTLCLLMV